MSLMLGGGKNNAGFAGLGNYGGYMTLTNNNNGSKKTSYIIKDNANTGIIIDTPDDFKGNTGLIIN